MSAYFPGEVTHAQGGVLTKALCDCGKPVRHGALRLTACPLEKALHVCAQAPLDCFVATDLRQRARLGRPEVRPTIAIQARPGSTMCPSHAGSNSISICSKPAEEIAF